MLGRGLPSVARLLCLTALLGCTQLTCRQNRVWTDEVRLWQHAARWAPQKPRPYINLGRALERIGDDAGAFTAYARAAEVSVDRRRASLVMAFAYAAAQTNLAHLHAKWGDGAMSLYLLDGVLADQPLFAPALFNKAVLLAHRGQCAEAVRLWSVAQSLDATLPANPCPESP